MCYIHPFQRLIIFIRYFSGKVLVGEVIVCGLILMLTNIHEKISFSLPLSLSFSHTSQLFHSTFCASSTPRLNTCVYIFVCTYKRLVELSRLTSTHRLTALRRESKREREGERWREGRRKSFSSRVSCNVLAGH